MSEYIEKKAFIDFIDAGHLRFATEKVYGENDLVKMISEQPAADVKPVVRGEWTFTEKLEGQNWYRCSVCKSETRFTFTLPRCPYCGAHMDGEKEGV